MKDPITKMKIKTDKPPTQTKEMKKRRDMLLKLRAERKKEKQDKLRKKQAELRKEKKKKPNNRLL